MQGRACSFFALLYTLFDAFGAASSSSWTPLSRRPLSHPANPMHALATCITHPCTPIAVCREPPADLCLAWWPPSSRSPTRTCCHPYTPLSPQAVRACLPVVAPSSKLLVFLFLLLLLRTIRPTATPTRRRSPPGFQHNRQHSILHVPPLPSAILHTHPNH